MKSSILSWFYFFFFNPQNHSLTVKLVELFFSFVINMGEDFQSAELESVILC